MLARSKRDVDDLLEFWSIYGQLRAKTDEVSAITWLHVHAEHMAELEKETSQG